MAHRDANPMSEAVEHPNPVRHWTDEQYAEAKQMQKEAEAMLARVESGEVTGPEAEAIFVKVMESLLRLIALGRPMQ